MARVRGVNVKIDHDLWETLDGRAADLEVGTQTYLMAVARAALARGTADLLAREGFELIEREGRILRRRPSGSRKDRWRKEGGTADPLHGGDLTAGVWWLDETWRLVRLGSQSPRTRDPHAGWYLEGPGFDEPVHLGIKRQEAQRRAIELVGIYQASRGYAHYVDGQMVIDSLTEVQAAIREEVTRELGD